MDFYEYDRGPLDTCKNVFLQALSYVPNQQAQVLINEWNEAIEYCNSVLQMSNK